MNTEGTIMSDPLDQQCVDTLHFLAVDMVQKANSGHPGLPLGAAPMAYALWTKQLKHNPAHPLWPDRDRFVLSAGHGSALLYSLLHVSGYDLSLEQQLGDAVGRHRHDLLRRSGEALRRLRLANDQRRRRQ